MKLVTVGSLSVLLVVTLVAYTHGENYGYGGGGGGFGGGGFGGGGFSLMPMMGYGGYGGGYGGGLGGGGGGFGDSWLLGFIGLMFILTILFSQASQNNSSSRIISI